MSALNSGPTMSPRFEQMLSRHTQPAGAKPAPSPTPQTTTLPQTDEPAIDASAAAKLIIEADSQRRGESPVAYHRPEEQPVTTLTPEEATLTAQLIVACDARRRGEAA